MILNAKRSPFTTRDEIRINVGREDVSKNAISRVIKNGNELASYYQTTKPYVSKINQKKRLKWCKDHRGWTLDDWRRVIWTDESCFVLRYNGRLRVWRRAHEKFSVKALKGNFKQHTKIMVWGAFAARGVGRLYHIPGIMDANVYVKILDNELRQSALALFKKEAWYLQHDNDPKHTAHLTQDYLDDHAITVVPWPPQSPDLNPIENLWAILDRKCNGRKCKNAEELFRDLQNSWRSLDPSLLEKLVVSMPRRIEAVIAAKGLSTKY